MKLSFNSNLTYQLAAIESVVSLFNGQDSSDSDCLLVATQQDDLGLLTKMYVVANLLKLSWEQVLTNLQKVQASNHLDLSQTLTSLDFSIEMETGTGKTYVYLRTIYELNKKYGFKKFVIVVPSIAIREGVLKNLEITFEHFQNLYDKVPVNYYVYDSSKVSLLRSFATNSNIEILVINIDSFAKDENIINRPNDKLSGYPPIKFIQVTNPIVIIDEPQNMETEKRKSAIQSLNPLCTLRYSATHRNLYNLVYSLNPVKAYDLGLVKQIEVDSVIEEDSYNDAFISVENITSKKTKVSAKLIIDVNTQNGVKKKPITVNVGADLYQLSNRRDVYKGFVVEEIDVSNQMITFTNGVVLTTGMLHGTRKDEVMKFQIERTIEEHLKKELQLNKQGIKVLSLFFIDRVANYRYYDEQGNPQKGKIALWFEEIYLKYIHKPQFKELKERYHPDDIKIDEIHNGYFSQDKKGRLKDTKGESEDDLNTYDLIMKDKEKLLSLDNPLRFIFSHTALREGWDNPNVFQICTLNETQSEIKKRQEIGRGLRLCVNQQGYRVYDKNINKLTLIVNESYESFAKKLQKEIEEECGVQFEGKIKNKRQRIAIKYRKGFEADPKFIEIWEKIKYKTRYRVEYSTESLIEKVIASFQNLPKIQPPTIRSTKVALDIQQTGIGVNYLREQFVSLSQEEWRIFDVIEWLIFDIIEYIEQKTTLTKITIGKILLKLLATDRGKEMLINLQQFLDQVVLTIQKVLEKLLVNGIKYQRIGSDCYEMRLFQNDEMETYIDDLVYKVSNNRKTIYEEYIPLDSNVESQFAKDCETSEQVEFYFKLPRWFKVRTPIGDYNPDWAVVLKDEKKIYFVAETKDTGGNIVEIDKLPPKEQMKIKCGQKHFAILDQVEYRVVKKLSDLIEPQN